MNDLGTFHCDCNPGYSLDEDMSTCSGEYIMYRHMLGQWQCQYNNHIIIILYTRIDIDECSMNVDECNQYCNNTVGSYTCNCTDGYILDNEFHCSGK